MSGNENNVIAKKTVKDLIGKKYKFYVPDYQRGYRWDPQQANDMLDDIKEFHNEYGNDPDKRYYMQPIVVKWDEENNRYRVVDGQQRLTTMFLLLKCLGCNEKIYSIEYQTREQSQTFLESLGNEQENDANKIQCMENPDFFHMYKVHKAITEWINDNLEVTQQQDSSASETDGGADSNKVEESSFRNTLLNKVVFIWYELASDEKEEAVFKRLNEYRIPLTDSELIKALFLNRANFKMAAASGEEPTAGQTDDKSEDAKSEDDKSEDDKSEDEEKKDKEICNQEKLQADLKKIRDQEKLQADLKNIQYRIASEWDAIEYSLQDDQFWLFIHGLAYNKSTRIDYILDMICEQDRYGLFKKDKDEQTKKELENDDHRTFRYFNKLFSEIDPNENKLDWLEKKWIEIKRYHQTFSEWYNDYELYHYIGYLVAEGMQSKINGYVKDWLKQKKSKSAFVGSLREDIRKLLTNSNNKKKMLSDLKHEKPEYVYDDKDTAPKKECEPILLLHNIETLIQNNAVLVKEERFKIANFNRFPFHLYKKELWDIEHISANAGDNVRTRAAKAKYLEVVRDSTDNADNAKNAEGLLDSIGMVSLKASEINELYDDIVNSINIEELNNTAKKQDKLSKTDKKDEIDNLYAKLDNIIKLKEQNLIPDLGEKSNKILDEAVDKCTKAKENIYSKLDKTNVKSLKEAKKIKDFYDSLNKEKLIETAKQIGIELSETDTKNDEEDQEAKRNNIQKIKEALPDLIDKQFAVEFNKLYEQINPVYNIESGNDENEQDDKNKLWNFTLLDSHTNREYGNYIFPIKRTYISYKDRGKKIRYVCKKNKNVLWEITEDGASFVVPCTMNVFMKYYTKQPKDLFRWDDEDREAYWNDMRKRLRYYIDK